MSQIITFSNKAVSNLTTPQLLKGGLYLTWAASLLLLVTTISGVQKQRHAIKTVGNDATPSIVTAQRLKDALAGMDANAANELLVPPGQNQEAAKGYRERYEAVAERLVTAAENISYGDKERKAIETMQLGLGDYIAKIQQARDFHARGETNAMLFAYRAAGEIMDKTLLPASDELDKINLQALEDTYAEQKLAASKSLMLIFVSGVALINVLVGLQIFLSLRMRRTLNPGLLGATAIAIIFLYYTGGALLSASQNLRVAKEDAFTSMHSLRQARAAAYIANTTESRYLLDSAFSRNHEQAFIKNITQIAQLPNGQTFESIAAAYSAQGKKVDGFKGYLAEELNNVTFDGEQKAMVENLLTLGKYVAIDGQIRQLERSGKHQEAIALCLGMKPGESNWAFDEFRNANQKAFDINQDAFDKAIKQGFQDVYGFEMITPVALSAIALLSLFGLLPRLKEYSA
ncbi:hypothetical protein Cylst_3275 [Cylindrospermum stagnale PCC 7417]|uniref:Uncharacterized protein n=1 Tax=Cylindrospermum stagnale PCC 7417 TaxID=56107 RepID=K9WYI4_9NOST|nr:hypothetical protein [Cylindrospermum stagnale]AFZ25430.1 hypothetical protein Cylst_3275 [Cylindrospermum stagnale PCC 7417]